MEKWKFSSTEYFYLGNAVIDPKWVPITKEEIKAAYKAFYEA